MWREHGTKIIGATTAVLGVVGAMSPQQLAELFGSNAPGVVMAALGLVTILRGFTNSAANGPMEKK
jgi:hypothetical protein